ncbi:hypothetical protein RV12_GL000708 [Enterococcus quebecensis]|nr:hypothetical protein RV12_GL000708 [Enterococcus quebecensis]
MAQSRGSISSSTDVFDDNCFLGGQPPHFVVFKITVRNY